MSKVGRFFETTLIRVVFLLITSWYVMIGLGVIHAEVFAPIKPVGYGVSVALAVLLDGVILFLTADSE